MDNVFIENLHGEDAFQGFAVDERVYNERTPFQNLEIFRTARFGGVLVLDGIVQTTEADEFMYHEMLVHVPMFATARPKRILIIGGGDGGSLREVLKHDIEQVDMVEIDEAVISACKKHLPSLNNNGQVFCDSRTNLIIEDAFKFLADKKNVYDVVVSDSTDPIGAAEVLFSKAFYQLCLNALKPDGAISLQNGVAFLQPEEPRNTTAALRELGLQATCYQVNVPTYYGGTMTLAFASRVESTFNANEAEILARYTDANIETRHYTPQHHLASFVLPKWIAELIGEHE